MSLWVGVVLRLSDRLQNYIQLCGSLISAENFFFVICRMNLIKITLTCNFLEARQFFLQ
ncbi:hypothetical protein LguiA_030806 [Lonicera macranthoides]